MWSTIHTCAVTGDYHRLCCPAVDVHLFFSKTAVQIPSSTFFLALAYLFIHAILMVHTSSYWVWVLSTLLL